MFSHHFIPAMNIVYCEKCLSCYTVRSFKYILPVFYYPLFEICFPQHIKYMYQYIKNRKILSTKA